MGTSNELNPTRSTRASDLCTRAPLVVAFVVNHPRHHRHGWMAKGGVRPRRGRVTAGRIPGGRSPRGRSPRGRSRGRMRRHARMTRALRHGASTKGGSKVGVEAQVQNGWIRPGHAPQSPWSQRSPRCQRRLPCTSHLWVAEGRKGGTSMEDLSRQMASSMSIFVCVFNQGFDIGKCECEI